MRLAALILAAAAVTAPAHAEKRTLSVAKFDKVTVAALMEVELRQGKQDVTVEQASGDFSDLKIEVRNGTLFVGRQNGNSRNAASYHVTVTAPDFRSITAAAASEIQGRNLALDNLDVHVSSASVIELKGACKGLAVHVSSGAHFDGEDLHCKSAKAHASTGAHAGLWVSGAASGEASTGGTITFAGNPKTLDKKAALGGTVTAN